MIKFTRSPVPAELTPMRAAELTQIYVTDKKQSVWNQSYIRSTLLQMSHSKCAYCESRIDEESKYMEVDHFWCKAIYPLKVVEWSNLLPSCKRCNGNKSSYDVGVSGDLIEPTLDDPRAHLRLLNYRLHGKDAKGTRTVEALYLNETDRVVWPRFKIGDAIATSIEQISEFFDDWMQDQSVKKRNKVQRSLAVVLKQGRHGSEFSATAATAIAGHPRYAGLRNDLQQHQLWTDELENLHTEIQALTLP